MSEAARHDEIETMKCCDERGCIRCHGSGRRPVRKGFLWVDGRWHKDRAPSDEPVVIKALNGGGEALSKQVSEKPGKVKRKPVPKNFKPTQRTMLRERALSYAIQAASAGRMGPISGAEIQAAAEAIERWIADTPMEKS